MPKKHSNEPIDMLESLLCITEQFKDSMPPSDRKEWQRISAETADLRLVADGGDNMDGDHESGLASAGFGTDEDYGYFGDFDCE